MGKERSGSAKTRSNKAHKHAENSQKDQAVKEVDDATVPDAEKSSSSQESLYPLLSVDNLLVLLYTCFVIWFGCTYQKLMNTIYSTEQWHFFDHCVKIMGNYFGYHKLERSLVRNLIFNTIRCMPEELIMYLTYGKVDPIEVIVFRLASIWAITIFV